MQPAQFFSKIKAGAYYNWRNFRVLPSVCAAQAALESGWGESGLTKQANNLFGMKGSYNGASITMRTAEYTSSGQLYYINAAFRKYPNWNASIVDYANNLRKSGYYPASAFTTQDYRTQITLIGRVYATSPTYASNVIKMIQTYGLDKWDRDAIAGGSGGDFDPSEIMGGGSSQYKTFREDYIKKNSATRPGIKLNGIKGLVIHEINTTASANAFRNTLNTGNSGKKMGYHVIVDSSSAIAVVPLNEGVHHANRTGQQLISGLGNPDNNTLSIGVINTNRDSIPTNTLKNLTLACAEIVRKYQLPTKNIWPGYLVDGVIEPVSWYYNAMNYSSFLAVTESVKISGENVITNPDYGSSSGSNGLIPGGEGIIKKLLEEAVYWEGKLKYSMENRYQIYPGGYADCSSYTQYVFKKATGRDIGANTWAQIASGNSVSINNMRAGDLVFWEKTYPAPPPTHVGIVLSGRGPTAKVIHCGTSSGVAIITANQIPHLYAARRLFSDADYEASQAGSNTSKPTLSTKSSYAVQVIAPTTAYSADTGGTSLKRLPTGEVYRVAAIGKNSVKVVSNSTSLPSRARFRSFSFMAMPTPASNTTDLWIPIHSTGIKIAELPTPNAPIGTVIPKMSVPVLDKPSTLGTRVYEGGELKNLTEGKSVSIYAIENRFAKIDPQEEQWVSVATAYADTSIELETSVSTEVDFDKGQTIETDILARYVPGDNLLNGVPLESGLVGYAHKDLLPIGSVISIYIPTLKEERKVVIISNYLSSSDGDNIEIYYNSERDYLNFGKRNGIVSLVGKIDISTELADFFNSIKNPEPTEDEGDDYFE